MTILRQVFKYDPVIGYRFIPGLKARIPHPGGGYLLRVNDAGFRCNHEFKTKTTPGFRRILLFGDSFTAGDGVSNKNRFGDLIEMAVDRLEIYNFGLPGTGTGQQYLTYKEYGVDIDHDVLIIAVFVDNIRRVVAHARYYYDEKKNIVCYEKPYFEFIDGDLVLRNVPPAKDPVIVSGLSHEERNYIDGGGTTPEFYRKLANSMPGSNWIKGSIQKLIHYQIVPEYDSPVNPEWMLMQAILKEWVINHSKTVLIVPIPYYHHVMEICDPKPYQSRMREVASETCCYLHDPLPDLMQYPLKERLNLFFMDRHLSPKGHIVISKSLAPVIEKLIENS